MSKRESWNQRYGESELVWGSDPNRFVAEAFGEVAPAGQALDLACGEGRNTIWLAEKGWTATGVDFSQVAIERARRLAAHRGVAARFIEADVTDWIPEAGAYALVLVAYLQVPTKDLVKVWAIAADALEAGGELFLIGHARRNLTEGTGGPRDPEVLWEPGVIAQQLTAAGFEVELAEHVTRVVDGSPQSAIDARIRARRAND